MNNAFFFETQQITENSILFDEFKKQTIFFSYFQVDQKYYLFFYMEKSIEIDFLYQSVDVIQELDSKKRKIRSLRGFFLYALEIIENAKDYEILSTNLQPFFWRKVKTIIRQNKKGALMQFLFGLQTVASNADSDLIKGLEDLEKQIQNLQNEVNSLQQIITELENRTLVKEGSTNIFSEASKTSVNDSFQSQQYNISSALPNALKLHD